MLKIKKSIKTTAWVTFACVLPIIGCVGLYHDWFRTPNGMYVFQTVLAPSEKYVIKLDFRSDGEVFVEETKRINASTRDVDYKIASYFLRWQMKWGKVELEEGYKKIPRTSLWRPLELLGGQFRFEGEDLVENYSYRRRFRKER